ncbi:MAG: hypothetical protein GC134_06090 [Proteobacteria bacterium]|nr:hypothetical protein [Pseudomonadota bacterium]
MTNAQILAALACKFTPNTAFHLTADEHPSCFQTLEERLAEARNPTFWWKPELLEPEDEILRKGHLFEFYVIDNGNRLHNMVAGDLTTLLTACKERLLGADDLTDQPDVDTAIAALLAACKGGLCIHANDYRVAGDGTNWNTLEDFVTEGCGFTDADEVVDRAAILATGTIWEVQFYCTATGFRSKYASMLDGALAATVANEL